MDVKLQVQNLDLFQVFPDLLVIPAQPVLGFKVLNDQELVAPVAVAVTDPVNVQEGLADLLQDGVPVQVAELVVKSLEVVNVDHHDRNVSLCQVDEVPVKTVPVLQGGQRVPGRFNLQLVQLVHLAGNIHDKAQDILELQAEVVRKALVGPQVFQLTILPEEADIAVFQEGQAPALLDQVLVVRLRGPVLDLVAIREEGGQVVGLGDQLQAETLNCSWSVIQSNWENLLALVNSDPH